MATEPARSGPPLVHDTLGKLPAGQSKPSANPIAARINNFLAAMNGAGDNAQVRYAAALDAMRAEPEQSVLALAQAEAVCNRTDYPLRWALVYAAAQMNHDAALPYLRNLILTPIPPEQSSAPHSFSTVGKETVLRTTAIEGVGRLAVQGNEAALPALFEFLSIASISVRRASVQAILAVNPKLRKKAAEALPADHRFLLEHPGFTIA